MKNICIVIFSLIAINLGLAQNNSFIGTFSNTQLGLAISMTQTNGVYTGQFQLQGNTFPITAQLQGDNSLVGSYPYSGNNIPLQINIVEGSYILITEGVTIPINFSPIKTRENLAPNNNPISDNIPEPKTIIAPSKTNSNSTKKASGQSIKDQYAGYQFNIPADWKGQKNQDGGYLIGHNTKPGFALIMPHGYSSMQVIYQESIKGIQEEGVQLMPTNGIQRFGDNGLIGDFSGYLQGQNVKANAISLLSPYGGGLTFLIAVKSDLYTNEYADILKSMANSVSFSKPKVSPVSNQFKKRIIGKRLLYMKTANGFSDKITIDLCSNGQFGYNSNSSGMSTGVSTLTYAGQDEGQGTWKVVARGQSPVLVMRYNNGEIYEYTLSNRDSASQINLNGRRYFIQNSDCY